MVYVCIMRRGAVGAHADVVSLCILSQFSMLRSA